MLDVARLRRRILAGVAVIAGLGLVVEVWHSRSHDAVIELLVARLSLSYEANVPTWFASGLLLACAVAAGAIAARMAPGAAWRRHWWAVAVALAYVSLDETAEFHEHLGGHLGTGGVLYFDWVIFGAPIVGVLAIVFLPWLRALPATTRRRLVVAAVVYVGGALVMDLPLGSWTERWGSHGLGYALIDWIGETMELVGAGFALTALVAHRAETA